MMCGQWVLSASIVMVPRRKLMIPILMTMMLPGFLDPIRGWFCSSSPGYRCVAVWNRLIDSDCMCAWRPLDWKMLLECVREATYTHPHGWRYWWPKRFQMSWANWFSDPTTLLLAAGRRMRHDIVGGIVKVQHFSVSSKTWMVGGGGGWLVEMEFSSVDNFL